MTRPNMTGSSGAAPFIAMAAPVRSPASIASSTLVRKLDPAAAEELDPVVRSRVMAGGEHHAEVGVERSGEVGDAGRGYHAKPEDVDARAREPSDDGGLEEVAGGTRIAADHSNRTA